MGVVKTKKLSPALGAITASRAHIHTQFAARQFADQWDLHMEEPLFVNPVLQMKANSLMWNQWELDTQVLLKILLSSYCICRFLLKSITLHLSLMGVESSPYSWLFPRFFHLLSTQTQRAPSLTAQRKPRPSPQHLCCCFAQPRWESSRNSCKGAASGPAPPCPFHAGAKSVHKECHIFYYRKCWYN